MAGIGVDSIDRVQRIEALFEIQQLANRYAIALEARDVDALVRLFVPDVRVGEEAVGREALRDRIVPLLLTFNRSLHRICGHHVDLWDDDATATGAVYCRAEHGIGERSVVLAICYFDHYRRVEGEWLFARRRQQHWHAPDVDDRLDVAGFDCSHTPTSPPLPDEFPTWAPFWELSR